MALGLQYCLLVRETRHVCGVEFFILQGLDAELGDYKAVSARLNVPLGGPTPKNILFVIDTLTPTLTFAAPDPQAVRPSPIAPSCTTIASSKWPKMHINRRRAT